MTSRIVYLVDDDEAVRVALAMLLETLDMTVFAFEKPLEFLRRVATLQPGCIILDVRMPELSGLKLQQRLQEVACDWPVVVISGHGDIETCRRAFRSGAVDFLGKPVDELDLIDAVQRAHASLEKKQIEKDEYTETSALLALLTARELEVLKMVVKGFTSREIADALDVSPRTVESHRAHFSGKLGTTSVAEMSRILFVAETGV